MAKNKKPTRIKLLRRLLDSSTQAYFKTVNRFYHEKDIELYPSKLLEELVGKEKKEAERYKSLFNNTYDLLLKDGACENEIQDYIFYNKAEFQKLKV